MSPRHCYFRGTAAHDVKRPFPDRGVGCRAWRKAVIRMRLAHSASQSCAGLKGSQHLQRLRDLRKLRRRRKALQSGSKHGVGVGVASGRAIESCERERGAQSEPRVSRADAQAARRALPRDASSANSGPRARRRFPASRLARRFGLRALSARLRMTTLSPSRLQRGAGGSSGSASTSSLPSRCPWTSSISCSTRQSSART